MSTSERRSGKIYKKIKTNEVIKIPKSIFDKTLDVINDGQHITWKDRNNSCSKAIHRSSPENDINSMRSSDLSTKMSLARNFLLKRDIKNVGKILAVANPSGGRLENRWYPLCIKYGVLSLAHCNRNLLNLYLQSLVSSENNQGTMEKYTKYSKRENDHD
ncbi:uncharacterized protein LOC101457437 [Ceratitis capitata]|uniref:uncharacterized protein LOC101457437 n=1 Tax=Ceratitis capitata TaxID=7213 RepID=UPI0003299FF0|nr:uncharacterized protein LOC101457437 [Ceratitis capitata]